MKFPLFAAPLLALLAIAPAAQAQDSLGFTGVQLDLGYVHGDQTITSADLRATVNITEVHGLQLDVSASDYGATWRGGIGAHLFMAPTPRAKYGLFAAVNDTNEFADTEYTLGAEVMADCGAGCAIEARAGVGAFRPGSNDYIFGRLAGRYALNARTSVTAAMDVIDIDEQAYSAREIKASAGIDYALNDRLSLDFGLERAQYSGAVSTNDTRVTLGVTTRLGAQDKPFSAVRPLEGLLAVGAIPLQH